MPNLEIIVDTVEDAVAAEKGGATQVVVVSHYPSTGITPSYGLIARIRDKISIPLIVLIRPNTRSSIPTEEDIETSLIDIEISKSLGINDFLLGFIDQFNNPHEKTMRAIKDNCGEIRIHSTTAWEGSNNFNEAMDNLIKAGFCSVRMGGRNTSNLGFHTDASQAVAKFGMIKNFIQERVPLYLTGGITATNLTYLLLQTRIFNIQVGRGVRTPNNSYSPVDSQKVFQIYKILNGVYEEIESPNSNQSQ
jgi:copper homeostasis protein